ncbi:MAG TPA: calcium-binding protein [Rhizomicrobium sp.]|jgi:Ca2+-binding RTX toxin-like protein
MKTIGTHLFGDGDLSATFGDAPDGLVHLPVTPENAYVGTSGNDVLTGTTGNDTFDLTAGGNDTVSALAGDDTITMGNTLTYADRIDGGDGNDTVFISGTTSVVLGAKTLVNVEDLVLANGGTYHITTNDATVAAGAYMTVDASNLDATHALTFNGAAETDGNFNILGGAGNDVITTGAGGDYIDAEFGGNDTINLGTDSPTADVDGDGDFVYFGAAFTAADSVTGDPANPSNDAIQLRGDYSAGVTLTASTLVNVGGIYLTSGASSGLSFSYNLTTVDATVASGQALQVIGTSLHAGENLTFNGAAETNGDFLIYGGAGNDHLVGGAGDDFFRGGAGDDYIDGGAGKNRATFSDHAAGVTVSLLQEGHAQNTGDGNDTLINIQDLSGTSGNDVLTGDNNANWLWGEGGNDTISGGGGNDLIQVGELATGVIGTDVADGGAAHNTLDFDANQSNTIGVTFSLALEGTQQATGVDMLTATNFIDVMGSQGDDILTGDANANTLYGAEGSDTLTGGAGNDVLYGDKGYYGATSTAGGDGPTGVLDVDTGTGGDDVLDGGVGNDTLDGGEGNDTAVYSDATSAVKVSLLVSGFQAVGGGLNSDSLISIENLVGSAYNDTLTGDGNANVLTGGAGNDIFYTGGAPSDVAGAPATVSAAPSGDIVYGGDGNDTVYYNAPGELTFYGGAGTDTLDAHLVSFDTTFYLGDDVERFVGGSGADTVTVVDPADTTALTLTGNAGNDNLTGGAANDHIDGGDGDDVLNISYGGNDTVTGDAGNDTIVAAVSPASTSGNPGLTASDHLDGGDGTDTLQITGDLSAGISFGSTTLTSVETIELGAGFSYKLIMADGNVAAGQSMTIDGSSLGASDVLTFNGAHETNGTYTVEGGAASDTITGGAGNDTIVGGLGADKLNGGAGVDTFVYTGVADSTGYSTHDVITAFDGSADHIQLPESISGVDSAVTHGQLRTGTHFDPDLALAIGSGQLAAGTAVVFTADTGNLSGHTYLIIDANGVAGYQAGADYVIELTSATNLGSLSTGSFVSPPG